ncbi:hypothetical protein LTS18_005601, partial [Coniosporium uncinatum]
MRQKAVDEAKKSETTTNRGWKDRLRSKSNNDLLQSAASAHDSRPGTSHLDRLGTGLSRLGSTARDETENRKSIKDSSGTGSRRNTLKHPASTGTLIPDVRRMTGADLSGSMTPESLAFLERQETILKRKTLEEAAASVQQLQHRKSQLEVLAPGPGSNISRPRTPRLSGTPGATLTPKGDVTPVRRGSETPSLAAVNAAGGGGAGSQLQQPAPVAAPLKKGENRLSVNTYARYGASGNGFDFNGFQQRPADGDEDRVRRQLEREKERAEAYLERRRMREEGLRLADEEDVTAFPEMREKVGGDGEGERVKAGQPSKRKRTEEARDASTTTTTTNPAQQHPRKRARPSTTTAASKAPRESQPDIAPSKRISKATSSARAVPSTASRKRKSTTTTTTTTDPSPNNPFPTSQQRQQQQPSKQYQYLKPRTHRIPASVIASKWQPLPAAAQQYVRALFAAAARDVPLRRESERRRVEVEETVGRVVRRLEKRVLGMGFPPLGKFGAPRTGGGGSGCFSLEALVERMAGLEAQVTGNLHAVELLEEAVEREEAGLERERRAVGRLEGNGMQEERGWRERDKKAHPLLATALTQGDGHVVDDAESIGLVTSMVPLDDALEEEVDEELGPLLEQLKSHVESIQGNGIQVAGVADAIVGAQASLDGALARFEGLQTG